MAEYMRLTLEGKRDGMPGMGMGDVPEVEAPDPCEACTPLTFVASTPGVKRDGIDTGALPWDIEAYRSNPVVTWVHDFAGNRLPIGRGEASITNTAAGELMRATITFDCEDEFAEDVWEKYDRGFLHAISVSWDDVDENGVPARVSGKKAVAHQLLEIAAVPVPGDPLALMEARKMALSGVAADLRSLLDDIANAEVVVLDHDPTETDEAEERCECGECEACHEAAAEDAPDDGVTAAVPEVRDAWPDVAAAMVAVFRLAPDDTDKARRRAYNALLPKYRRARREPPEFMGCDDLRALGPVEWRGLWLEGELDALAPALRAAIDAEFSRKGAVISQSNMQDLRQAYELLGAVISRAEKTATEAEKVGKGRADTDAPDGTTDDDGADVLRSILAAL